ncbi:MAG: phospho-N-acetylmuramoyl-pentapeptide-transferase [Candidatus Omnitrophica bacterium]|nr:phospho-N-acetylmuramoyl-pentapeptide-transferase [Candidatus Omnitrophota bacterium]
MLYYFLYSLREVFFGFNIFKYITFRSVSGFITSFLLVIILGKFFIRHLKRLRLEEYIDMYGHVKLQAIFNGKKGTPTMGGILIVLSILFSVVLWAKINVFVWLSLLTLGWFSIFGFVDDYLKLKNKKGLKRLPKFFIQIIFGSFLGFILLKLNIFEPTIYFPFFKNLVVNLGIFYIIWTAIVVSASCNSVNFTDGLDGLAIGSILMVALTFSIFSYVSGNVNLSGYLFFPFIEGTGELTVVCSCILGAGLGFLWFNAYPAEVFMGDVGSSSLGGLLGVVAILIKKEIWLLIAGGLFVIEALSVILQIGWVKIFSRKLFKAAPLHHHLQLSGWPESKVTIRLWIISVLFSALALATLKVR